MGISNEQNTPRSIRFLTAQRYLYSKAKRIRNWRVTGIVGLAFISPIIFIFSPQTNSLMGILGSIWLVLAFILNFVEIKLIKISANIQEQLDVSLFKIDWNEILVGKKVTNEIIANSSRQFFGDKQKLKNWYGELSDIEYPYDILVCQRSNLVWDWRLRRKFSGVLIIVLCLIFLIGITIAILKNQSIANYFWGILLPSLTAFIYGIKEIYEHLIIAKEKENLMGILDDKLESSSITTVELRQIQDKIYELRTKQALIPEWWYKKYRTDYELDLMYSNNEFRRKLKNTVLRN